MTILSKTPCALPVLIPEEPGDLASLCRAIDALSARGRPFIADSVLDPIHFGLSRSVARYVELRDRYPGIEIMMGTGNVSELTDADTAGLNAFMLGVMSELRITHLLTTEVSPHARAVVREIDCARRMLFAAHEDRSLPRGYDASLCALHERKPFPYSESEIAEIAAEIRDPSYRVNVSETGIHVYNRDGMTTATDPYDLYPRPDLLQSQELKNTPMPSIWGWSSGVHRSPGSSASDMYRTSPSNGAVPCVPLRPRTPRARTPRPRP